MVCWSLFDILRSARLLNGSFSVSGRSEFASEDRPPTVSWTASAKKKIELDRVREVRYV